MQKQKVYKKSVQKLFNKLSLAVIYPESDEMKKILDNMDMDDFRLIVFEDLQREFDDSFLAMLEMGEDRADVENQFSPIIKMLNDKIKEAWETQVPTAPGGPKK